MSQPVQQNTPPEVEQTDEVSKSERKRQMHALQTLGEALVVLPDEQLRRMPLPEQLQDAVMEARRIHSHGARKRQLQYIGKIMRGIDPQPIQQRLNELHGVSAQETARQHRLEKLRVDLLADEKTLEKIKNQWPSADLQYLRQLRRNALKEQAQQKPPRAFRQLFKTLRELEWTDSDAGAAEDADDVF